MRIRKAILTGGGRATRLRPITTTLNKHLIPLANQPMIFHAIQKAAEAGIEEIFINTNPGETELPKAVGDGSRWGIKIKYFEQTGGPQGIAHVVKCAEPFIGSDPFMFYLSDNIILGSLRPFFSAFSDGNFDGMLAFAQVPDPERFGVPVLNSQGQLIDTLEKPSNPPNDFAITGIYLFGPRVFFEAFARIKPSARGEYELPDVVSYLLKNGKRIGWQEITGWWKDTGKPEDLLSANRLLLDELAAEAFVTASGVEDIFERSGNVAISHGTVIGPNVLLRGPVMIGESCMLENCTIGPYVTVGKGSTVKQATIKESIVLGNCVIDAPIQIAESIIGEQAKVLPNGKGGFQKMILGDHTLIKV
ncbi:MAG: glucose-1-phosphate thymidylyltransferase [Candidatus Magasanikbacteria bacterium]|nr:glucose-1-phosphate thymidylyltransferase [Candidatus Magasanikbacteria bacterium]